MKNVERNTGNPLQILGIVHHGLIILNHWKVLLKFTKYRLVFHALDSWMTILELDDLFTYGWVLFMHVML